MYNLCTLMKIPKPRQSYVVLTPTEERIVRFLTEQQKEASITDLSRGVSLARTSIYNATRSLIKKQLLKKDGFTYRLRVTLEPSENQKSEVSEQIQAALEEILHLSRGEIVYSIESDEEISELLTSESGLPNWQKQIADRKIVLKGVGSTQALSMLRSGFDDKLKENIRRRSGSARFLRDELKGPGVLLTFKHSVIFFSRKRKYFYRIDDAFVARFIQNIIDILYLSLEHQPVVERSE